MLKKRFCVQHPRITSSGSLDWRSRMSKEADIRTAEALPVGNNRQCHSVLRVLVLVPFLSWQKMASGRWCWNVTARFLMSLSWIHLEQWRLGAGRMRQWRSTSPHEAPWGQPTAESSLSFTTFCRLDKTEGLHGICSRDTWESPKMRGFWPPLDPNKGKIAVPHDTNKDGGGDGDCDKAPLNSGMCCRHREISPSTHFLEEKQGRKKKATIIVSQKKSSKWSASHKQHETTGEHCFKPRRLRENVTIFFAFGAEHKERWG